MTVGSDVGQPSPLGLRLVHAALFLAFAAGVGAVSVPEWTHLALALGQPFHAGVAPRCWCWPAACWRRGALRAWGGT
ncbi:hypothetical protein ACLEPN_22575 [Myxococcus sp. 1LA]